MANVKDYTNQIRKARYGKEVRSSIADSIDFINEENEASVKKVNQAEANINKAVVDATNATNAANTAASAATTAANNANEAAQAIFDEKYILTARTEFTKSTTVSPTSKGNAILEKLRGDGWQRKLTGKNWCSLGTKEVSESQTYLLDTPIPVGTYTLSADITSTDTDSSACMAAFLNASSGVITNVIIGRDTRASKTFTLTDEAAYMRLNSSGNGISASSGDSSVWKDIQVEPGEVTTDFEPYCGATPSPNPSYEQKIRSVGDMGWFDGEWLNGGYESNGVFGDTAKDRVSNKNHIPCNANDVICIKADGLTGVHVAFFKETNFVVRQVLDNTDGIYEFTAPSGVDRFYFNCINSSGLRTTTVGHVCVTINGKYALIVDEVGQQQFIASTSTSTAHGITNTPTDDGNIILNGTSTTELWAILGTIDAKANEVFTLSANKKMLILVWDKVECKVVARKNVNVESVIFETQSASNTYEIALMNPSGTTFTNLLANIMIVKGSNLATWKPYQSTRHYIPLDEPLRAIGDVKDEIVCQDGVYGALRRIKEVVLDGSEDEAWTLGFTGVRYTYVSEKVMSDYNYSNGATSLMANNLEVFGANHEELEGRYTMRATTYSSSILYIMVPVEEFDASDIVSFTSWLAYNPITVHYELATPTFTPFEDQTPFYNLMAYDEVTHVSIAGCHEELNPSAVMRFPRSEDGALVTTNWCDNRKNEIRMDELTAALLALGQA